MGNGLDAVNAAVELMRGNLERHPGKIAYICGERTLTYRELDEASRRCALRFRELGIRPGERVAVALPDCCSFPVVFLGCLLAGVVAVAVGSAQRNEDLAHIVSDSGATLLVSHRDHACRQMAVCGNIRQLVCDDDRPFDFVSHGYSAITPHSLPDLPLEGEGTETCIPHNPSSDECAYLLYSSGSTGRPKGIPHRHDSLLLPCRLVGQGVLGLREEDLIFSTSKLSFCYGLINSLSFPLYFGATAILHPGKPDVDAITKIFRRHTPSVFFSVPTLYRQIVLSCAAERLELPLRLCCSAGETLPPALFNEWRRLTGLELLDGIGASELSHHFICNPPGRAVAGSAGRVVPGYRVRLVDSMGNDVSAGREGQLLVAGETRARCYWNLPEQSRLTMGDDGFTRTGDIFLERDGYYFFRGRIDDMIKVDAQWVAPVVVEDVLRSHPAVAECAVTAVNIGGMARPAAFLVLVTGRDDSESLKQELAILAKERLPEHMRPVRYHFPAELPRTSTGKIRRSALGSLFQ